MNLKESERLAIKIIKDWSFVDTNSEETKLAKAHLKAVGLLRESLESHEIIWELMDKSYLIRNIQIPIPKAMSFTMDLKKWHDIGKKIKEALGESES